MAFPGVEEGTSYGTPAFRCKKKLIARLHQDGKSLVLKVGDATRDHLLHADPDTFFITSAGVVQERVFAITSQHALDGPLNRLLAAG